MKSKNYIKTIKPGSAIKNAQRIAKIRTQIDDENERHAAVKYDFMMQRRIILLNQNQEKTAIDLARIANNERYEDKKHTSKISTLTERINKK